MDYKPWVNVFNRVARIDFYQRPRANTGFTGTVYYIDGRKIDFSLFSFGSPPQNQGSGGSGIDDGFTQSQPDKPNEINAWISAIGFSIAAGASFYGSVHLYINWDFYKNKLLSFFGVSAETAGGVVGSTVTPVNATTVRIDSAISSGKSAVFDQTVQDEINAAYEIRSLPISWQ